MKKYLLYFLLFIPIIALSQNLVPNPGFESTGTVLCGWCQGQSDFDNSVTNWTDPTYGTSDILSTLISPSCSNYQPHSTFSEPDGYQAPHSGNIFAGLITFYNVYEYREYIQNQLTAPMVPGKTYAVSMYVSLADNSQYSTNDFGVYFSTMPTDSFILNELVYTPQANFTNTSDTAHWVLLSDTIVATDNWQYIVIGNFHSDATTTKTLSNPLGYYEYSYYYLDDVSIVEIAAVAPPVVSFQASDTIICTNDCISFTDRSTNATSWAWTFDGGLPPTSTDENPQFVCYENAGIYNVTLVASNAGGKDSITISNYINAAASPPTPNITQSGDTLLCSTDTSYISYQWYDSTAIISGATNPFYVAMHNGNFNVQVANNNGCKVAVGINVILNGIINQDAVNSPSMFPNPVTDELTIYNLRFTIGRVEIYDVIGHICARSEIVNRKSEIVVDVSSFTAGMYIVKAVNESELWVGRFVKE